MVVVTVLPVRPCPAIPIASERWSRLVARVSGMSEFHRGLPAIEKAPGSVSKACSSSRILPGSDGSRQANLGTSIASGCWTAVYRGGNFKTGLSSMGIDVRMVYSRYSNQGLAMFPLFQSMDLTRELAIG